jgi:phosphatidylglycerophosphate synthase
MILTSDFKYTLIAALIIFLLAAAYGARVAFKGRVHFDRIERRGGSRLLGKGAMEFTYWCLEPAARLLVFIGTTPNQVSWASLGFGFLAGGYLAVGHFGLGAVFAMISGLLDSLDGMVARISGHASDAGEVLDAAVDRYVEFFFFSGLIIYYEEIPILQLLTLLALLGSFMVSYSTSKAEALGIDLPQASMRRPERAVYLTFGAALSAVTIPWLESAHSQLSAPPGYPMVIALGFVAGVANVSAVQRFWSIAKAIRMREKDLAEAPIKMSEHDLIEEKDASPMSHHPTGVQR